MERTELRDVCARLSHQKVVGVALVDEQLEPPTLILSQQLHCVIGLSRLDRAQVPAKGFDAPRAGGRVADGGKGGDRGVGAGVLQ
eukprot:scaffold28967_cov118-Isochrysis_galbana.AAC.4